MVSSRALVEEEAHLNLGIWVWDYVCFLPANERSWDLSQGLFKGLCS